MSLFLCNQFYFFLEIFLLLPILHSQFHLLPLYLPLNTPSCLTLTALSFSFTSNYIHGPLTAISVTMPLTISLHSISSPYFPSIYKLLLTTAPTLCLYTIFSLGPSVFLYFTLGHIFTNIHCSLYSLLSPYHWFLNIFDGHLLSSPQSLLSGWSWAVTCVRHCMMNQYRSLNFLFFQFRSVRYPNAQFTKDPHLKDFWFLLYCCVHCPIFSPIEYNWHNINFRCRFIFTVLDAV